jgi:hypothetical protein
MITPWKPNKKNYESQLLINPMLEDEIWKKNQLKNVKKLPDSNRMNPSYLLSM